MLGDTPRFRLDPSQMRLLKNYSISDFIARERRFATLPLRRMDIAEIKQEFLNVLSDPRGKHFAFPTDIRTATVDTPVFRVRNLHSAELTDALAQAADPRSFDLAPKRHVRAGRLNLRGKPTFYGTLNTPLHSFYEVRAQPGDILLCARFEVAEETGITAIACPAEFEADDPDLVTKIHLITGFMQRQFNRDAGPENEYNYSLSHAIVDDYYTYPPALTSGWMYPSIQDSRFLNIALPEINFNQFLRLKSVSVIKLEDLGAGCAHVTNHQILRRLGGVAYLEALSSDHEDFVSASRGLGFTAANEIRPVLA